MSEGTTTPEPKKTRKVPKYVTFQPGKVDVDPKGTMHQIEMPKTTKLKEVLKHLNAKAEALLDEVGLDEMVVYIFQEPIKRTIKREVKVTVT